MTWVVILGHFGGGLAGGNRTGSEVCYHQCYIDANRICQVIDSLLIIM